MAYTTQQLITNAYYLSQIVSRGLETVTQDQISDGLFRLNGFISMKGAQTKLIPYYKTLEGNFVQGVEKTFFPGLIHIESITFFLENPNGTSAVRFQMWEKTRWEYFATNRVEHINSLPNSWHMERVMGGSDLYVYVQPFENYRYQILGKFELAPVALNQDLAFTYDNFYMEYLMYGLAIYLCEYYDVIPAISVVKQFQDMEQHLTTLSRMDLTNRKLEYFAGTNGFNYAQASFKNGWTAI